MSRDAKIGLVIVCAFVFLFGTVLVHRLQSSDSAALGTGGAAAGANDTQPSGDSDAQSESPAGANDPEVVEGVNTDPREPLHGSGFTSPDRSQFGSPSAGGRSPRPPDSFFPDPPSGDASGAQLTLAEAPESGAVVVEPPSKSGRGWPDTTDAGSDETESTDRSGMLLEITNRQSATPGSQVEVEITPNDSPTDQMQTDSAEQSTIAISEPGSAAAAQPEAASSVESPVDRPRTDESANSSLSPVPFERSQSPPPLPRFGDPPGDPTHVTQDDRTGDMPTQPGDDLRAGQSPQPTPREREPGREFPGGDPATSSPFTARRSDMPAVDAKTYVVQEGDSFWSISAKFYGTGRHFRALEDHNADRLAKTQDGRRILRPGVTIAVPAAAALESRAAVTGRRPQPRDGRPDRDGAAIERAQTPVGPGMYRVQDGDTLSTISESVLGTSKRWEEIYRLNQDKLSDPHRLQAGMVLRMPPP